MGIHGWKRSWRTFERRMSTERIGIVVERVGRVVLLQIERWPGRWAGQCAHAETSCSMPALTSLHASNWLLVIYLCARRPTDIAVRGNIYLNHRHPDTVAIGCNWTLSSQWSITGPPNLGRVAVNPIAEYHHHYHYHCPALTLDRPERLSSAWSMGLIVSAIGGFIHLFLCRAPHWAYSKIY